MSSFHGIGIEKFHCIQRCPQFKGVGIEEFLYTKVSISEVEYIHSTCILVLRNWNREIPLHTLIVYPNRGKRYKVLCSHNSIESFLPLTLDPDYYLGGISNNM